VQLDDNRIAIRERDFLELLDLALRVVRAHAWPLAAALACGVVPAMCLNAWLLAGLAEPGFDDPFPLGYMWLMLWLVIWELPLVTAPVTLYLGRALFSERPRPAEMGRNLLGSLPQMALYQVVLRAFLVPLVFTWFFPFAVWPYLSEVILLERNPLWRRRTGRMTTHRRNLALHGGYVAELLLRWIASVLVGLLLFLTLWLSIWLIGGMLLNEWEWSGATYTVCYPLAMWIVIGFFAVVRFLAYLDLRIRREGWDVELLLRAEGARLRRQLT
jgi:hypothetical protein